MTIEAWEKIWDKTRHIFKGKGQGEKSRAPPSAWGSGQGYWQAASQWRGAAGADVMRERAISVVEVTQPGFTGLSFHTSRYLPASAFSIIIFMLICAILFFIMLACTTSLFVSGAIRTRRQNICETFVISSAIQLLLMEPHQLKNDMTNLNLRRLLCHPRSGFHLKARYTTLGRQVVP